MKTNFALIMTFGFLIISIRVSAQKFDIPLEGFSRNMPAYLHMEDGTMLEGLLGGFTRSKGLVKVVKIKDDDNPNSEIEASEIAYMYLPPSRLGQLGAAMEKGYNVRNWKKETTMDTTSLNKGYVYFEKTPTELKKGTENLLLQLMNASFSDKIKVYHDPYASETASIQTHGIAVIGGLDKSYYIKKESEEVAHRLMKKDYEKEFKTIFGDCPELMSKYGDNIRWADFEAHVFEYTQLME